MKFLRLKIDPVRVRLIRSRLSNVSISRRSCQAHCGILAIHQMMAAENLRHPLRELNNSLQSSIHCLNNSQSWYMKAPYLSAGSEILPGGLAFARVCRGLRKQTVVTSSVCHIFSLRTFFFLIAQIPLLNPFECLLRYGKETDNLRVYR